MLLALFLNWLLFSQIHAARDSDLNGEDMDAVEVRAEEYKPADRAEAIKAQTNTPLTTQSNPTLRQERLERLEQRKARINANDNAISRSNDPLSSRINDPLNSFNSLNPLNQLNRMNPSSLSPFINFDGDGVGKMFFRVATFNVWGLIIAKNRAQRIDAIARYFSKNPRDLEVVALQELWVMEDYRTLKAALSLAFPYSHYFDSGVVGSGLAIFSRYPIVDSWWLGFTATGKPQRIFDGDWYAGKGIGAVRIRHPRAGSVDIFDTHLIADYSPNDYDSDWYKAHRATQLYELVRHVDRTSSPGAFTIVLGDFNTQPIEDAYMSLIRSHDLYTPHRRPLRNVWRDVAMQKGRETSNSNAVLGSQDPDQWTKTAMMMHEGQIQHNTFNLPTNTFYKSSQPTQQIDHIMYVPDGRIRCVNAQIFLTRPLKSADGQLGSSYSDHAAIMATFELAPHNQIVLNDEVDEYRLKRRKYGKKHKVDDATHRLMIRLNEEIQSLYAQQWSYRVGAVVCAIMSIGLLVSAIMLIRRSNEPEEMQRLLTVQNHKEDYKWWQRISLNWYALLCLLIAGSLAVYFYWLIWNAIVFLPQEIYALRTFQYEWALWLRRH